MDDLISRQAAIDAIKTIRREIWGVDIPSPGDCPEYVEHHEQMKKLMHTCDNLIKEIEKQPPAERTGRWSKEDYLGGYICYRCSECKQIFYADSRFCPFCGSRNHKREDYKL